MKCRTFREMTRSIKKAMAIRGIRRTNMRNPERNHFQTKTTNWTLKKRPATMNTIMTTTTKE
jgi:hypothetical protein